MMVTRDWIIKTTFDRFIFPSIGQNLFWVSTRVLQSPFLSILETSSLKHFLAFSGISGCHCKDKTVCRTIVREQASKPFRQISSLSIKQRLLFIEQAYLMVYLASQKRFLDLPFFETFLSLYWCPRNIFHEPDIH